MDAGPLRPSDPRKGTFGYNSRVFCGFPAIIDPVDARLGMRTAVMNRPGIPPEDPRSMPGTAACPPKLNEECDP
jgi:hypothetical protein